MLPLLLALAAAAVGTLQWSLPTGWESLPPPQGQGIDYIYLPTDRKGPSITVSIHDLASGSSLKAEADDVARTEAADGRTIQGVQERATCSGKQPAMDVSTKFGNLVSQLYHVTIDSGKVYVIIYTYAPKGDVAPNVRAALDSLCAGAVPPV